VQFYSTIVIYCLVFSTLFILLIITKFQTLSLCTPQFSRKDILVKMSESKEENSDLLPKSKPQEEHGFSMDFDIGFESLWPLDHISLISNPMSPFLLSTISEQPFSPVWAFSDVEDERQIRIATAGIILCLPQFPILSCFFLFWFV